MKNKLCILICEHFKKEAEAIIRESDEFEEAAIFSFSAKCGRPPLTWETIHSIFPDREDYGKIYVLGGACISQLETSPENPWYLHRVDQCFHLIADPGMIHHYLQQGSYLLSPGWLTHWQEWIEKWGFDKKTAREFFAESAKQLVLLDTHIEPDVLEYLNAFSDFVGLSSEVIPVDLGFFRLFLKDIILQWRLEKEKQDAAQIMSQTRQQVTEYAAALDLIGRLAQTVTEDEAIQNIIDLFTMLFAPGDLFYMPLRDGEPGDIHRSYSSSSEEETLIQNRLISLSQEYAWTESGKGFQLQIHHQNNILGILEADKIAFPEYKEKYLNLALNIIEVCGLAINNARRYQQIIEQKDQLAQTLQELRETQKQLIEAEKMASLGNLVAGVAHEINTPVGICITAASNLVEKTKSFAEMFKANQMKRTDLQNYLQSAYKSDKLILSNMQRIGDLIQSFKRVSVDQASERQRIFQLKPFLEDVIRSLEPTLKKKPIHFNIDCHEDIELDSFPGVFSQIFTNFIINSQIHGFQDKESGHICIRARVENNHLILGYQDDGKGISPDILAKIFDPFFTTNKQTGSGLGMHIVYNLITQKLKGTIHCDSYAGQGVLFEMTIPLPREKGNE